MTPKQRRPGQTGGGDHYQSRLTAGRTGGRKRGGWGLLLFAVLVALTVAVIVASTGCATPYPGKPQPAEPADGAPSVHGITWSHPPDTRTPISMIPWCDDESGHSQALEYPCKWDARERPAPTWDPFTPPVVIWVWRETGCDSLIGRVKISDDNSVAWACLYAPGRVVLSTP